MKKRWTIFVMIILGLILVVLLDMTMSATKMTQEEQAKIRAMMAQFNPPRDPKNVTWKWLHGWRGNFAGKHGINASYRCISDSVVVPEACKALFADPVMADTYQHELTHAHQRKEYGLLGYLWRKTFHRKQIEDEACAAADLVLLSISGNVARSKDEDRPQTKTDAVKIPAPPE